MPNIIYIRAYHRMPSIFPDRETVIVWEDTAIQYPVQYDYHADFASVYFDSPRHGWAVANIGQDFIDSVFAGFVYEYKASSWQHPVYINGTRRLMTWTQYPGLSPA